MNMIFIVSKFRFFVVFLCFRGVLAVFSMTNIVSQAPV